MAPSTRPSPLWFAPLTAAVLVVGYLVIPEQHFPLSSAHQASPAPDGEARAIAIGTQHACGIDGAGLVRCWGEGASFQRGDGTRDFSAIPRPVPGIAGATVISAAEDGTCAVHGSGAVACWGTHPAWPRAFRTPHDIAGLPPVKSVSLGPLRACAVTEEGDHWCWGSNIGPGDPRSSYSPLKVPESAARMPPPRAVHLGDAGADQGIAGATSVAVGASASCAALAGGGIACWGDGHHGLLGPAAQGQFPDPVRVEGLPAVTGITASWHETCALAKDNVIHCWGGPDLRKHPEAARVRREPLTGVARVAMSYPDVCAVMLDGNVQCRGALGGYDKDTSWKPRPELSGTQGLWLEADNGDKVGYALSRDGRVTAFQVRGDHRTAVLEGLGEVSHIAAGDRVCVTGGGPPRCFRNDEIREALKAGKTTLRPKLHVAKELDHARTIGEDCAIDGAGHLVCWGVHLRHGALALYEMGAEDVTAFARSSRGICAILRGGQVSCRGPQEASFTPVAGISDAVDIAVGEEHACALKKSGEVWCWGDNEHGAIGQDRPIASTTPVRIPWEKGLAPAPSPPRLAADEPPPFLRRRPGCGLEGVDACVYLGCAGPDCLTALLEERDPVRRRYMRRLSDAAARVVQEVLAHGDDPGGVPHAEMAMFCADSGPCGKKDASGNTMDDGYACLTKAEGLHNLGEESAAESRAAQERACRCDPVRAQIPIMGGVLACDGHEKPVERGGYLSLAEAHDVRDCAECDPDEGPRACVREIARLETIDAEQARFVREVQVPRCREE